MKRVFGRITAALLVVTGLGACSSQPDSASVSGTVTVLTVKNQADSPDYKFDFVQLLGLSDLLSVSGKYVNFIYSPRITNHRLDGPSPHARFMKNKNGDYVPMTDLSLQMAVIYFHIQNLALLDKELGVGDVNHWPRDIGVGVRMRGGGANNAYYDGDTDSILVLPYSLDNLPIAVNAGILAHEHFHSLFYKLVNGSVRTKNSVAVHDRAEFLAAAGGEEVPAQPEPPNRPVFDEEVSEQRQADIRYVYSEVLKNGMNEGIADFWAWVYTGNADFIASSLPVAKEDRTLNVKEHNVKIGFAELRQNAIRGASAAAMSRHKDRQLAVEWLRPSFYVIGTKYARSLKALSDIVKTERSIDEKAAGKLVAKWVLQYLNPMGAEFRKKDGNLYDPSQFIEGLAVQAGELKTKECEFLADLVNSNRGFENNLPRKSCEAQGETVKLIDAKPDVKEVKVDKAQ